MHSTQTTFYDIVHNINIRFHHYSLSINKHTCINLLHITIELWIRFPMHPNVSHFELQNLRYVIFNIVELLILANFAKREMHSLNEIWQSRNTKISPLTHLLQPLTIQTTPNHTITYTSLYIMKLTSSYVFDLMLIGATNYNLW